MLNRWSAVFLLVGAVLGYALAGHPVAAQSEPHPIAVGDQVSVTYENGRSFSCIIGELHGIYMRCDATRLTTTIGRRPAPEHWLSLRTVVEVHKHGN